MAIVNACEFPPDLLYALEENTWVREDGDGCLTMGLTDPGQTKAGRVLVVTYREIGKVLRRGKGGAIMESSKWVGRFVVPVSGKLIATNPLLAEDANQLNRDPYGKGWILRLEPSNWASDKGFLVTEAQAAEYYREVLAREELNCVRCSDGMAPDHEWKKVGL